MNKDSKKKREGLLVLLFWVFIWSIIAMKQSGGIIPSPLDTIKVLVDLMGTIATYGIIGRSLIRVLISLSVGIILGVALGMLSGMNKRVERILKPMILVIKSTPVVCFIIILWLYVDKAWVPSISGILLCFPIIYSNIQEGYKMVDTGLLNMSNVYNVPLMRQINKIYIPSTLPYLFAGILTSIGICWKATIAAEVISVLDGSIGMQIYNGKVVLDFESVFAWTIIIIVCSMLIEVVTKKVIKKINFYERFKVI